jgi:Tol biopolymer transport system component
MGAMRSSRAVAVLIGSAVGVGAAVGGGPAGASFPGHNGKIVFARVSLDGTAPSQIFTVRQDGTRLRKLTKGAGDKFSPSYSADGRRIAFSRSTTRTPRSIHIVVMDADGRHRRQLTHAKTEDRNPAFAPDGRTLAFARVGEVSGIYSIRMDGSHSHLLVRDAEEPVYSPDGRRIVYESFADGKEGLFIMDADGSHRRQLTHDPLSAPDPAGQRQFLHVDRDPDLAPDGRHIVFVRQRAGCAEGGDIYVMNPDGTHVHAVTDSGEHCASFSAPAFAPGGDRVVASGLSHLDVMRVDGTHGRVLRSGRNQYHSPDWQPLPR